MLFSRIPRSTLRLLTVHLLEDRRIIETSKFSFKNTKTPDAGDDRCPPSPAKFGSDEDVTMSVQRYVKAATPLHSIHRALKVCFFEIQALSGSHSLDNVRLPTYTHLINPFLASF